LFARPGDFLRVLPAFWGGVLLGPLTERVFYLERLRPWRLFTALTCLPLMLAHPARPRSLTAALTAAGFVLWYGAALLIIVNYEARF
jgi:hypothetical protein